ncbi:hypothetical protein RCO48_20090 [Peribacillus frigoritolerans]|nr:hypothetical protein [Peribacillus frigoritolerans]
MAQKMLRALEAELQKREIKSLYLLTANDGLAEAFYLKNDYVVNEDQGGHEEKKFFLKK